MLGYRTFFHVGVPHDEVLPLATSQLYAWLREKAYDADALRTGQVVSLADGVEALRLESSAGTGTHTLRVRITEGRDERKWVSQLTVHVPRRQEKPWVWLDINAPDDTWTGTPRLARNLLEVFPSAFDGEAELGPAPRRSGEEDAETLLDVVCDPDRRGLVLLAGSDDELPIPRWFDMVGKLAKETVGLAATYVLDGPATARFAELIGTDHAVAAGTVRTFLPAVDPADPQDAIRHRVLGTNRILTDAEHRLARLLGWKARERAIEAPLPKGVTRVGRVLETLSDQLLVSRLTKVSPDPVRDDSSATLVADGYPAVAALAQDLLGTDVSTSEAVAELKRLVRIGVQAESGASAVVDRLKELQDRADELELENQLLSIRLVDEQIEHAAAVDERARTERTVSYLRRELVEAGGAAQAWNEPRGPLGESGPDDFRELLDRVAGLKFVSFTGAAEEAYELDKHDSLGVWAGKAWSALLALEDYARLSKEGQCPYDVDGYLEFAPEDCHLYPHNKHARDESADVHQNRRYRAARTLPVPTSVNAEGTVFMGAHFRIAQSGMISPRLHYFDATAATGMIYVGYIGRHLPTKRTN